MKLPVVILSLFVPFLLQAETQLDKELAKVKTAISEADDILAANQNDPKTAIPAEVLAESEAVLIVKLEGASIGIGGYGGTGIAMLNNIDNWSPPAVYSVAGGSLGIEIGGTETDMIAVFMNKKSVKALFDKTIKWGVGLSVKAGPVGGTVATNQWKDADILVYRVYKGFKFGVSFSGGSLDFNQPLNAALYEEPNITANDIFGLRVPMPAEAKDITEYLRKLSFEDTSLSVDSK